MSWALWATAQESTGANVWKFEHKVLDPLGHCFRTITSHIRGPLQGDANELQVRRAVPFFVRPTVHHQNLVWQGAAWHGSSCDVSECKDLQRVCEVNALGTDDADLLRAPAALAALTDRAVCRQLVVASQLSHGTESIPVFKAARLVKCRLESKRYFTFACRHLPCDVCRAADPLHCGLTDISQDHRSFHCMGTPIASL